MTVHDLGRGYRGAAVLMYKHRQLVVLAPAG
jgi:hypothetical protein